MGRIAATISVECIARAKHGLLLAFFLVLVVGVPTRSFGQSCGGADQRACCITETSACQSGLTVVLGCPPILGDPNFSGGCGCSNLPANAITSCVTHESCGGNGQRACCNGNGEFSNNGLACNSGLVQVPGCDETTGNCFCGSGDFKSAGTCVQPTACGGIGQRACCVGTNEFSNNSSACNSGLTAVGGCAGDCTCGGTTATGQVSTQSCTTIETISEPDTNATPSPMESGSPWQLPSPITLPSGPECPASPALCGYSDLHVHMFAHLAHGGATIAGTPYDPINGVNTALGEDYGSNNTIVNDKGAVLNKVDGTGGIPQCPDYLMNSPIGHLCANQYLFHGDHTPFDTTVYGGTNDATASNLGAPLFNGWPQWTSTIHQQVYYKWLERAWLGGLRLMVMDAVTNETLCKTSNRIQNFDGTNPTDCTNSMISIDAQLNAAIAFQAWLDTQYGGPGQGWFQIVTTPQQATAVIQAGKLAVVLGIEVENLFNCHSGADTGNPFENTVYPFEPTVDPPTSMSTCSPDYVKQQVQHYYDMGVRHIFPIHNFDNAYGGPAAWQDSINVGNNIGEGHYWAEENCYNNGYGFWLDPVAEGLEVTILDIIGFNLSEPPPYPLSVSFARYATCNTRGLTSLGQTLINALMDKQMIIDIDHMSLHSLNATLTQATSRSYPGIAATHVQFFDLYNQIYSDNFGRHERMRTQAQLQQIKNLGGLIAVMLKDDVQDTAKGFCLPSAVCFGGASGEGGKFTQTYNGPSNNYGLNNNCRYSTTEWAQAYMYGADTMGGPVAMGSDFNGIAGHVGPRFGSAACGGNSVERSAQAKAKNQLLYPFTLAGFGTFDHQVSGQRSFDFNTDGLAHIGLLPDMVADLKNVGLSDTQLVPLFSSAQAYINMWSAIPAPTATQFAVSAPASANAGTAFNFTVTALNANNFTVSGYVGTVHFTSTDGAAALPADYTFTAADNGVHTFTATLNTSGNQTITATDAANSSITGTSNNIVVNQPPAFTSVSSTTFTVGALGSFNVTATGVPASMTFSETGTLPSVVTLSPSGVLSGTPAAGTGGVYPFTITASNGISPNATQLFTLTVDQAPAITSPSNATFTVGTMGSFTVTATGFPAPSFSSGALPGGLTLNALTGVLSGKPAANTGGVYNITITASNGVLPNATQSFTLTVDQALAITSATGTTFTVGAAGSFQVTATGYPAATFTETGALPSGVTLTPAGVLGVTPGAGTGGVYNITITASNGVLPNATQVFTLTVDQAPAITSGSGTTFTAGTANSFQVTATGYPASTFTEIGALPSGVTLSPSGVLGVTPGANTGGVYNITITASNGVLPNATQGFTLTVNQPPAITSPNNATFTVGTMGSFTVTGTGFPAPTFFTGALPSGLTLNALTGVLSGTPAAGTGGTYPITLQASNGVNPFATQNFTLRVQDFTISAGPTPQTIPSGHTASYTISLTSLGGLTGNVALSCSGAPQHSTCTVTSPVMLNGATKVTVKLSASQQVNHGTFTLTFTATQGSISHSTNVVLTVK